MFKLPKDIPDDLAAIFDAQLLMLDDPLLVERGKTDDETQTRTDELLNDLATLPTKSSDGPTSLFSNLLR